MRPISSTVKGGFFVKGTGLLIMNLLVHEMYAISLRNAFVFCVIVDPPTVQSFPQFDVNRVDRLRKLLILLNFVPFRTFSYSVLINY
jgi:hypothetical protein